MPLDDIKDAGTLAGFVRWGWPYHGLCVGGTIGSSGKTITQPDKGATWLIDKGYPALDISPAEIASEALEGREWRNYALISGGTIYGKSLPTLDLNGNIECNTYIHIDEDGAPWMVTLSETYPSTNTVRMSASIVRFGHFEDGVGPQTPITKTADAGCVMTELAGTAVTQTYNSRFGKLHDVYTNGSKALYCIEMTYGDGYVEVLSAIEVVFSGVGGADGSGLSMTATEAKGQPDLSGQEFYDAVVLASSINTGATKGYAITDISTTDCPWLQEFTLDGTIPIKWPGGGMDHPVGGISQYSMCRRCFYDTDGAVMAMRLVNLSYSHSGAVTITAAPVIVNPIWQSYPSPDCAEYNENPVRTYSMMIDTTTTIGVYIKINESVIDSMVKETQTVWTIDSVTSLPSGSETGLGLPASSSVTYTWTGSLTAGFPEDNIASPLISAHGAAWLSPLNKASGLGAVGTIDVGIYRVENCAGFYLDVAGVRTYGPVATPLGAKTTTEPGEFYFSWQRKTGEFAFSPNPICYV